VTKFREIQAINRLIQSSEDFIQFSKGGAVFDSVAPRAIGYDFESKRVQIQKSRFDVTILESFFRISA